MIPFITIIFVLLKIDFLHQNSYLNLSAKHPVVLPSFFYTFPTEHYILFLSKLLDSILMANLFATYLFTTSNIFEYELGMKLFKHIYVQINRMIFIDKIHEVIAIIRMYQFLSARHCLWILNYCQLG